MATNFPTSLDALANPQPNNTLDSPSHSTHHTNLNDCIEALEAKVGVNSSSVATSHDKILTLKANIASPTFTGTVTAPTFSGSFSGSGAGLTGLTGISNAATTASTSNVSNAIVARDVNGSFAAATITANSFVGSITTNANLTGPVTSVGNATTITDGAVTGVKVFKSMATFSGATYTVQDSDYILTHYGSTITYVTLPNASSYTGRPLLFRQIGSAGIISDTTNVIPKSSTSPSSGNTGRPYGPVITSQTQGTWAELVSNGTNWVIVSSDENIA